MVFEVGDVVVIRAWGQAPRECVVMAVDNPEGLSPFSRHLNDLLSKERILSLARFPAIDSDLVAAQQVTTPSGPMTVPGGSYNQQAIPYDLSGNLPPERMSTTYPANLDNWFRAEVYAAGGDPEAVVRKYPKACINGMDLRGFFRHHFLTPNPCREIKLKPTGCPKCGHAGDFVRMALCCPQHGAFGGC